MKVSYYCEVIHHVGSYTCMLQLRLTMADV